MSKLGLTPEEQAVVAQFAGSGGHKLPRLMDRAAQVLPPLVVGTYGIVKQEQGALVVAVVLGIMLQAFRWPVEVRYAALYRSIFSKIDAFERQGGEVAP
jgi:hypothetical protein